MKQQETEPTKSNASSDTQNILNTSRSEKTPADTSEHAGKWAVLAVVAIGVFMATWTQ